MTGGRPTVAETRKTFRIERVVWVLEQITVEASSKAEAIRIAGAESRNHLTRRVDTRFGKWRDADRG